jgi:hypothetical protein
VSLIVLLDAGPLGMITNPKSSPENEVRKGWLANLVSKGIEVIVPGIADYEVPGSCSAPVGIEGSAAWTR